MIYRLKTFDTDKCCYIKIDNNGIAYDTTANTNIKSNIELSSTPPPYKNDIIANIEGYYRYIQISPFLSFDANFFMEFIVYPIGISNWRCLISSVNDESNKIFVSYGGENYFYLENILGAKNIVDINKWNVLAVQRIDNVIYLFKNGNIISSTNYSGTLNFCSTGYSRIGYSGNDTIGFGMFRSMFAVKDDYFSSGKYDSMVNPDYSKYSIYEENKLQYGIS